jgi:uncharacterized damage-inducible protein DinB
VIAEDFVKFSAAKLRQFLDRIEVCLGKLTDSQVWSRGHESENSVGNLCLHLTGNVRQWIISSVGGEEDERERDVEFRTKNGVSKEDLAAALRFTVLNACAQIEALSAARLEEDISVQGYEMTVLRAVYHVVEHFAQHTGQIVFATKALTGEDMGFYRHLSVKERAPDHQERTP